MPNDTTPIQFTEIVFPEHTNHYGTLFGGNALRMMSKAAFTAARQHAQGHVVMASVSDAQFMQPVPQGSVLHLRAWVSRVGRSSMTVCVHGMAQTVGLGEELALQGVFEMVAVDGKGQPTPISGAYLKQESQA